MTILLVDPVGDVQRTERRALSQLSTLMGMRAGFVFNQQMTASIFWKRLETEVTNTLKPSTVHRIHKDNTYMPAAAEPLELLIRKTDYALVGVGA